MINREKIKLAIYFSSIIIVCLGLSISLQSLLASWSPPTAVPPSANVFAPINVSNTGQAKQGGLILNTGGSANGLVVGLGNVGIGLTDPLAKLAVNNSTNPDKKGSNTDAFYAYISGSNTVAVSAEQGNSSGYSIYSSGGKNYFGGDVEGAGFLKLLPCPVREVPVDEISGDDDERLLYEPCQRSYSGGNYLVKLTNPKLKNGGSANDNFFIVNWTSPSTAEAFCNEFGLKYHSADTANAFANTKIAYLNASNRWVAGTAGIGTIKIIAITCKIGDTNFPN